MTAPASNAAGVRLHRTPHIVSPAQTVADVVRLYLKQTKHEQSRRTFEGRKPILEEFAASYPQLAVSDARPHHLKAWVNAQRERWPSAWTRRRVIATVRGAFGWALSDGYTAVNPFAGVHGEPGERGEPMTPEEFQALLPHCGPHFRRLVIFIRYTGCRPGEAESAEWRHLDKSRSCIELDRHKTWRKTRKLRRITLHPVALALVEWIDRHSRHPKFIFENSRGGKWTNTAICWRLTEAKKKAGVRKNATLYGLRHLLITQAILNGVDLPTVQEIAGHERIETTMHYCHVKTEHVREALKKTFRKH